MAESSKPQGPVLLLNGLLVARVHRSVDAKVSHLNRIMTITNQYKNINWTYDLEKMETLKITSS